MRSKNSPRASAAEVAHLGRVKQLRCVCCYLLEREQSHPTDVHHIRAGGEARSHWLVIPLCWDCHQGQNGVEEKRTYLRILKVSEWGLLAIVMQWLMSNSTATSARCAG